MVGRRKGKKGGEGMLVGSGGASTGVRATTSTVSPPIKVLVAYLRQGTSLVGLG